jgi:hypothetical protein
MKTNICTDNDYETERVPDYPTLLAELGDTVPSTAIGELCQPVDPFLPAQSKCSGEVDFESIALGEFKGISAPTADIDLDAIAIGQDFQNLVVVKTEPAVARIAKPEKQIWFSPCPEQEFLKSFYTLQDNSDRNNHYILHPKLAGDLEGEYTKKLLVPCITRQGVVSFWPIKLPDEDGKIDRWNGSALEIATSNGGTWCRLKSDHSNQCYQVSTPGNTWVPPTWPDDLNNQLKKAVAKVFIDTMDHPLIKRLRGED